MRNKSNQTIFMWKICDTEYRNTVLGDAIGESAAEKLNSNNKTVEQLNSWTVEQLLVCRLQ